MQKIIIKFMMISGFFVWPLVLNANEWGRGYMGIDLGGAWGSSHYQTYPGCGATGTDATFCNVSPDPSASNGEAVANSGSPKLNVSAYNMGFHLGYNWAKDCMIWGGEVDVSALHFGKSNTVIGLFPLIFLGTTYALSQSVSTDWLSTIRGRIGAIISPALFLYGTGGAAFTKLKISSTYNDNAVDAGFPGGAGNNETSVIKGGWTVGGGAEWRWTNVLSFKAEYLYVDFSPVKIFVPTSNTSSFEQTMRVTANLQANIVRLGVNYGF